MAILPILQYPDARLNRVAKKVEKIDEPIRKLIRDMVETMYAAPGIGLAATQVDKHIQLIVMDISETHDDLKVFINPELIRSDGEKEHEEGCLSVPGIYDKVSRKEKVTVSALDEHGKSFAIEADGLLAVCIQHEMDHLQGHVFVEHLSQLKQTRIRAKLKKQRRETL
jgi:peptide deformylase